MMITKLVHEIHIKSITAPNKLAKYFYFCDFFFKTAEFFKFCLLKFLCSLLTMLKLKQA